MIYHSGSIYIFWQDIEVTKKSDEIFSIWLQSELKYTFTYDIIKMEQDFLSNIEVCDNNKLLILKCLDAWVTDVDNKWNTNFI